MNSYKDLRQEVERRISENIVERVLERAVVHHTRRSADWRECSCTYCVLKREATINIGEMIEPRVDPNWVPFNPSEYATAHSLDLYNDWGEVKQAHRDHFREFYRDKLRQKIKE